MLNYVLLLCHERFVSSGILFFTNIVCNYCCGLQASRFSGMDQTPADQSGVPGAQSGSDSEREAVPLPRELGPEDVVDPTPAQDLLSATPAAVVVPPSRRPLRLAAEREHWLFLGREVSLDQISFDTDCSRGQIRPLNQDILKQKREEFSLQPPLTPLQALLVATDLSGVQWGTIGLIDSSYIGDIIFFVLCFFLFVLSCIVQIILPW